MRRRRLIDRGPYTACLEVKDGFCRLIRRGLPPETACDRIGISHSAFWNWIRRARTYDENGGEPEHYRDYSIFARAYRKARSIFLGRMIDEALIKDAEPKHWRRALEILQRRDQGNWACQRGADDDGDDVYDPDDRYL